MSHLPNHPAGPYSASVHDVSLWPSAGRWLGVAALAVGAWLATALFQPAQAGGVNWSIGVTFPGAVAYPAQPVYQTYPAAPVYPAYPSHQAYPAQPVVVYPARPVVYPVMPVPAPVYGYRGYREQRHHHHHHERHWQPYPQPQPQWQPERPDRGRPQWGHRGDGGDGGDRGHGGWQR